MWSQLSELPNDVQDVIVRHLDDMSRISCQFVNKELRESSRRVGLDSPASQDLAEAWKRYRDHGVDEESKFRLLTALRSFASRLPGDLGRKSRGLQLSRPEYLQTISRFNTRDLPPVLARCVDAYDRPIPSLGTLTSHLCDVHGLEPARLLAPVCFGRDRSGRLFLALRFTFRKIDMRAEASATPWQGPRRALVAEFYQSVLGAPSDCRWRVSTESLGAAWLRPEHLFANRDFDYVDGFHFVTNSAPDLRWSDGVGKLLADKVLRFHGIPYHFGHRFDHRDEEPTMKVELQLC